MKDLLPALMFAAFGGWWLIFPDSVLRFYAWFHRGKVKLPQPLIIRIIGAASIVLIGVIYATVGFR
jgi:hypothetical protein